MQIDYWAAELAICGFLGLVRLAKTLGKFQRWCRSPYTPVCTLSSSASSMLVKSGAALLLGIGPPDHDIRSVSRLIGLIETIDGSIDCF